MPTIIPPIAPPADAPNVDATIQIDGIDYTVAAGATRYTNSVTPLFRGYGFGALGSLINSGTVWASGANAYVLDAFNLGYVINAGSIVAQASAGTARALYISSTFQNLTNSGSIYALATGGAAIAFENYSGVPVNNTGVIAAQSDVNAVTMLLRNGGRVSNGVNGSILAEGPGATAISFGRGHVNMAGALDIPDVNNAGRIEAQSTDPTKASVAIIGTHLDSELFTIVNSGTIRGDYAIYVTGAGFSPPQKAAETITNLTGGTIDGFVYLDYGDDVIVNHGTIIGDIDMGEGNDLVDNSDGVRSGATDLGFGEDRYVGGAGSDYVMGERGDDVLSGGAGNDLLLGGRGNDVVRGDAGNDGLYGEGGDDVIATLNGDVVFGGLGNDRIELGDLAFRSVDGGAGDDVLVLPAQDHALDLQAALATGRITGIEEIRLAGGDEIVIRSGDVAAASGGGVLRIGGGATDKVDLVGNWVAGSDQSVGGTSYHSWSLNGATLLVAAGVVAQVMANAPGGAVGLDAIAAGDAPALPGAATGVSLATSDTLATNFYLAYSLTIDADEHWANSVGTSVLSTGFYKTVLTNRGLVTSDGTGGGAIVAAGSLYMLDNSGTIRATVVSGTANLASNKQALINYGLANCLNTMRENAFGFSTGQGYQLEHWTNSGRIEAITDQAIATALYVGNMPDATNSGVLTATSSNLLAIGLWGGMVGTFVNSGSINASGATAAYGAILAGNGMTVTNAGTVSAMVSGAGATAIGFDLAPAEGLNRLVNSGTITADVAIQSEAGYGTLRIDNSGHINGKIMLSAGAIEMNDQINNIGWIAGDVLMGSGRDVYVGSGGHVSGTVFGQDGNDFLVSGGDAERLDGGAGDDILVGQAGDTLVGGAGSDTFVFSAAGSTPANITDFVSGTDHIDFSGLAPTSVTLTANGGMTLVTATGVSGTLTINVLGTVTQADIRSGTATVDGTANADSLVGGYAGSTLHGLGGDDVLAGMANNDKIDGGTGNDVMIGGLGDDTYYVDSTGDSVFERAGGGFDTVINTSGYAITLNDNIEAMTGGSGTGNALDNIMTGGAGADSLNGAGGSDSLYGGLGNDTYYVDRQSDLVFEKVGEGTDTVIATGDFYLYANIENLTQDINAGNIFGVGNDLANVITGSYGDNTLLGGGGDDKIMASFGNDIVYGQDGNDRIDGEAGNDFLAGGNGDDQIEGNAGADIVYGEAGNDVLRGGGDFVFDMLVGGDGNDTLRGDSGYGDFDYLYGNSGDDSFYVDTPADLAFEQAGEGIDTVYANIIGAGYYLYANIENLVLQGNTPFGVGNDIANVLTGNAIGNYLLGGAGNDTLNGKAGNDVLFGESGADIFVFEHGTGGDVIGDFVPGTDKIDLTVIGYTSFAQVQAHMVENGGTTAIDLGNGDLIVLNGVTNAKLHAGDFILPSAAAIVMVEPVELTAFAPLQSGVHAMGHDWVTMPIF